MSLSSMRERIQELAYSGGVDIIKFTGPEPFDYAWENSPRRDPRLTLPNAQTLIICGVYIGGFAIPNPDDACIGQFSRLILSGFYYDVTQPLKSMVTLLEEEGYEAIQCDGFADRSILPLKLAAVRAGIGWQGKNSLLTTREYGSYLALGGLITDAPLEHDAVTTQKNHCGQCQACQKACPTNALEEPYKLNLKRCLSYLLEGDSLPDSVKAVMGNQILECDRCQSACPWNTKQAKKNLRSNYRWSLQEQFGDPDHFFRMSNLIKLTAEDFDHYLGYRLVGVGYDVFRRNLIAAMVNSQAK